MLASILQANIDVVLSKSLLLFWEKSKENFRRFALDITYQEKGFRVLAFAKILKKNLGEFGPPDLLEFSAEPWIQALYHWVHVYPVGFFCFKKKAPEANFKTFPPASRKVRE